jgi:hypothetical protein
VVPPRVLRSGRAVLRHVRDTGESLDTPTVARANVLSPEALPPSRSLAQILVRTPSGVSAIPGLMWRGQVGAQSGEDSSSDSRVEPGGGDVSQGCEGDDEDADGEDEGDEEWQVVVDLSDLAS